MGHVQFEGALAQADVAHRMQESDIFVLPSRLEGTPKVVLEAAATGLPCVIFDDYHTPSVVDRVTGFQVKEYEEMRYRIECLIQDGDLRRRMAESAVEHAKKFDWDCIVKLWEEVFEKVVTQKRDNRLAFN